MYFQQIVHTDIGCASYVLASTDTGEALVVDPRWDIEPYLDIANRHAFHITKIVETHNHADHVSGHGRLSEVTGAEICIHELAGVEFPHRALSDGDVIAMDDVQLHVLHLPGHRPEHIGLAVEDRSRGADPWMVLTGDSLFVGDVARPDLAVDGTAGASLLFDSLHDKLFELPEFCGVYPAHVAGSLCGRVSSQVFSSTLGYEKRYNSAIAISDRAHFVEHMNQSLPQRPPNMERIVAENQGLLQTYHPRLRKLSLPEASAAIDRGAVPLDVRPTQEYLHEHMFGSIHVSIAGAQFGVRAGFVIQVDAPIVLVATSQTEALQAQTLLRVVAYRNVSGYVLFSEWKATDAHLGHISGIEVHELKERVGGQVTVVDVRDPNEWASGTIPGAVTIPYREIQERAADIPRRGLVAVTCESGGRSAIAASLLERAGVANIVNVEGGVSAWRNAGYPLG